MSFVKNVRMMKDKTVIVNMFFILILSVMSFHSAIDAESILSIEMPARACLASRQVRHDFMN